MKPTLIAIDDICLHHHIELKFIQSLEHFGLIQTTVVKQNVWLDSDEVSKLERFIRLSHDLDINLEGLHAVANLLEQVHNMQKEITSLKNEISYYKQIH